MMTNKKHKVCEDQIINSMKIDDCEWLVFNHANLPKHYKNQIIVYDTNNCKQLQYCMM